jgi:hypothetical protein
LRKAEGIGQVAHACLTIRLCTDETEDAKAGWLGEDTQRTGEADRGSFIERWAGEERATVQQWQLREVVEESHRSGSILIQINELVCLKRGRGPPQAASVLP